MPQNRNCRLCVNWSEDFLSLYNETGQPNSLFELVAKFFHPTVLNINEYKELNTICQTCWGQIWTFLNFQKSVKDAQKRLKEFLAGRANETAYFDELIEVESQTFIVKENLTEAEIRTGNTFKDILAGKNNGHLSATKDPEYIIDGPTLAHTRSQDIKQEVQLVEIVKDPVIKEEEEEVIDVHSDVSQDTWDEEMSSILCYANNRKDNFKNIDKVEEEEEEFINVTDDQNDVHLNATIKDYRKDQSLKGHTSIESVQESRQLGDGVVILTRNKTSPNVKAREVSNTIKRAKLDIKDNVCGDVRNSGDNKKLSELTQSDIVIKEEVELIDVHVDSQDTWSEEMTQSSAFTSLEYASNDDSLHNAGDLAQDLAGNFSDNSNEENAAVYILDQSVSAHADYPESDPIALVEEIVVGNVETITESSLGVLQMDTDVPQDISAIETIQTTIIKEELEIDEVPKDSTEEVQQEKKKTEKMPTALGKPESTTRSQPQLIPDNSSVQDPKITTATNKTITTKPPYTSSKEIPLKPRRTVRGDIVSYFLDKIVDVVTVDSSTTTSVYSTDSQPEDIEFEDLVLEYLKNIKCSECAAVMESLEKYVSHFLGEHPKEHFYVSCCHIRFRKLNILKHHLRQHKDVGYNHVTMPKDKVTTNNKAPTAVTASETTKETHKRKHNPKVFNTGSRSILDAIHTERSSHSDCVICGKKFVNGNALDFHYRDIHCIVGGSKTVAAKVRRNR